MLQALRDRAPSLILIGLLFGLLVLLSAQITSGKTTVLESAVFRAFSPVVRAFSGTVEGAEVLWSRYVDLRGARIENESLRRQLEVRELERSRFEEVILENARLRELLRLRERVDVPTLTGRILANDSRAAQRSLILDRGSDDGVRVDMPVLAPAGVVGRVVAVAGRTCKVQLITDADSGTAVRVARTRLQGLVRGRGADSLLLEWVPQLEDIRPGDRLVTSGLDRVHLEGYPVGTVLRVRGGAGPMTLIDVAPAVNPARLEEVLILQTAPDASRPEPALPPVLP
ncbi:MAG: rod shape-determining protein MreC [Acidobacteriota bacterium]|jgi:rod shape-determining protein MreC